jgi:hypothetical protein
MPIHFCPQCGNRTLAPDHVGRCSDCSRYPVEPFRFDTTNGARLTPVPKAGPVLMSSQPGSYDAIGNPVLRRHFM